MKKRLKAISSDLKMYVEKRVELLLLNIGEQFARIMAESVQKVTGLLLLSGAVIFLLVALAIYLGTLLDSESLGYVLVSVPLVIIGLLFYYLKPRGMVKQLQNHFEREIIRAITEDEQQRRHRPMLTQKKSEDNTQQDERE
ncbi:MAG: phage holin family protein [Balneolaceae bacterium]|nr:phage holin family protein [Balneolaceae bacterium]